MTSQELWKFNILDTVKLIADKNLQKVLWFSELAYIYNPNELYCKLFDDDLIENFLNDNVADLSHEQLEKGDVLVLIMNKYSSKYPDDFDAKIVIQDPEWNHVVDAASAFYIAVTSVS